MTAWRTPRTACIPSYSDDRAHLPGQPARGAAPEVGLQPVCLELDPVSRPAPAVASLLQHVHRRFVYGASPINVGQTGVRGFGGDASGLLCFNPDGSVAAAASASTGTGALS